MTQAQPEQRSSVSSLSDEAVLFQVPSEDVDEFWHIALPYLVLADVHSKKMDARQYRDLCKNGTMDLWLVYFPEEICTDGKSGDFFGAFVTEIVTHLSGIKVARILSLGGKSMNRWIHLTDLVEEWARQNSCDSLEIGGRKGWGRVYPDYKLIEYVFSKELNP